MYEWTHSQMDENTLFSSLFSNPSFIAVWTGAPGKGHGLNEDVGYCFFLFSLVIPTHIDTIVELCVQRVSLLCIRKLLFVY